MSKKAVSWLSAEELVAAGAVYRRDQVILMIVGLAFIGISFYLAHTFDIRFPLSLSGSSLVPSLVSIVFALFGLPIVIQSLYLLFAHPDVFEQAAAMLRECIPVSQPLEIIGIISTGPDSENRSESIGKDPCATNTDWSVTLPSRKDPQSMVEYRLAVPNTWIAGKMASHWPRRYELLYQPISFHYLQAQIYDDPRHPDLLLLRLPGEGLVVGMISKRKRKKRAADESLSRKS